MNINKNNLNNQYLYFLFFLLGFNKFILYLPAAILYLLLLNKKWQINKSFFLFTSLNILAIIFVFFLGHNRMTLEEPLRLFIVFFFMIIVSGFLIQNKSQKIQINLLYCYILGLGSEAITIAGYTYIFNDGSYGYGNIYDPFSQKEINSPITSNNLSILASLLLFYLFNFNKKFLSKILTTFLLLIIIALAIFLGGRTFFVILLFALLYSVSRPLTINKLVLICIFIISLLLASYYISDFINIDFILKRFEKGLESSRFSLYQEGFQKFWQYPFGGYSIDPPLTTKWFHNIFLDMGRLAGWIPVILFSISLAYVVLKSYKKIFFANANYNFVILMSLVSFLILQQDTSIEGDYRAYIVLFLSSIVLLSNPSSYLNDLDKI